jgi:3-oxoacyl-[acyl-carrier protein] reductase
MKLSGQVVLITGASSGIGEATARLFSRNEASVVVNFRSNIDGAKRVVKEIRDSGGQAIFIRADISKPEEVNRMFDQIFKEFGTLDILINNAGSVRVKSFAETTIEDWTDAFNDNLFGAVLCSQKAAEVMLKKKRGKILNISSIRGMLHTGGEEIMAYSAAKAAINSFTKTLAKKLAPYINVNAVAPGVVRTPNYDNLPDDLKNEFINASAIKRWITVDEVAEAFLYLATADAITGSILMIDGGFTLKQG